MASSESKADEIYMEIYAPLPDKKNNVTITFFSKNSTPLTEIKKISLSIMDKENPLGNQYVDEEEWSFRNTDDQETSINPTLKVIDVFPECKPFETLTLLLKHQKKSHVRKRLDPETTTTISSSSTSPPPPPLSSLSYLYSYSPLSSSSSSRPITRRGLIRRHLTRTLSRARTLSRITTLRSSIRGRINDFEAERDIISDEKRIIRDEKWIIDY